jgi:hypothetical protein
MGEGLRRRAPHVRRCEVRRAATISACGLYRFTLDRNIEPDDAPSFVLAGTCAFLLNNPSVADGMVDDPTVIRGIGYTIAWGYARMIFVNANPWRATDPKLARVPPEDVLAQNDELLRKIARDAELVVCGWGDNGDPTLTKRALDNVVPFAPVYHLGLTKKHNPRHPLYLKKTERPRLWLEKCLG